jgi:glycosyltransferase involved in cell wall biosynthesis
LQPQNWARIAPLLGEHAAELAERTHSGLFAYSHVASPAFARSPNTQKLLFQVQPHPATVRRTLAADRLEFHDGKVDERFWPESQFETYSREPRLADLCIVPSSYCKATLRENGVDPERIAVIPYGVDLDFFMPSAVPRAAGQKFTVLFVGQPIRQKGIHYLLQAWKCLQLPDSELRITGDFAEASGLREHLAGTVFLGRLNWNELREEYRRADLLCMPSLTESFGHVMLEALACGTPVLATDACGAPDVIHHDRDGFVTPAGKLEALRATLASAARNRDQLHSMRPAARSKAEQYPWSRFRKHLVEVLRAI